MDRLAECCGQISIHFCSIVRQMCTQYNGIATLSYVNKDVDTLVSPIAALTGWLLFTAFFLFLLLLFLKMLLNRDSRTHVFMCKLISGLCVEVGLIPSLNSVYLFVSEWERIFTQQVIYWIGFEQLAWTSAAAAITQLTHNGEGLGDDDEQFHLRICSHCCVLICMADPINISSSQIHDCKNATTQ